MSRFYPHIFLTEYEKRLYNGRKIARQTALTVCTSDPEKHHKILDDLRWNFQSINLIHRNFEACDHLPKLNIDRSVNYMNIDGLLATFGITIFLTTASSIYGSLCNQNLEILNYGKMMTEFLGDTIDWKPGNLPMEVREWSNHLVLQIQSNGPNYFDPSFMGII